MRDPRTKSKVKGPLLKFERLEGGFVCVRIQGNLIETGRERWDQLGELARRGDKLAFDFGACRFVDSGSLGRLLLLARTMSGAQHSHRIVLGHVERPTWRMLRLLGFDRIFERDDALLEEKGEPIPETSLPRTASQAQVPTAGKGRGDTQVRGVAPRPNHLPRRRGDVPGVLKFEELESGGVYARIPGELSEMDPEAWDRLCELARRKDKLALDLAACDRVDSTSIARLLRLRKIAVVERGHELVLGHLSADLQGTLLVTGLDRIFTIDDATLDQLLRPCLVTFVPISAHDLKWLRDDVERMKGLSPGQFQGLIADRLDRMGLQVRMVGDVFRRDGGIDIIASQSASGAFPFLLAVQVKHHRAARKTTAPEVREFHGALSSCASPFQMGLIVTNTTFTADAAWFAAHNQRLLRLRDCQDLRRWLQDEFVDDSEWREVPAEIEVAPGIRVLIPRPHPVLSRTH